ncbi:MAG: UDP-N-acetylglucosamine 2-epimerase (non-hydrolyzing) [Candidatus Bathyarchaeia archaeon]
MIIRTDRLTELGAETTGRVMVIAGTRPEFIKLAPVIDGLRQTRTVDLVFISSGQHFDAKMSETFIKELGLPEPTENFKAGGRSDAQQIAKIIGASESAIRRYEPQIVLAEGDTNTVVAVALAAAKVGVPFWHVEAGLRSFDRTMPEEINRILSDGCSELCLCPTEISALNLSREGILPHRVRITGNTVVDACQKYVAKSFSRSNILSELGLKDRFGLVTIHRKENVDNFERLSRVVEALCGLDQIDLVFPIHPRTKRRLAKSMLWQRMVRSPHIVLCEPLGYFDFLRLLASSVVVLTDSGGVQEEALTLRVPCLTIRENTERPETVMAGGNTLVGTRKEAIASALNDVLYDPTRAIARIARENPLGDGRAGARIATICSEYCEGIVSTADSFSSDFKYDGLTILTVRAEDHGVTVEEFCDRIGQVMSTTVYDRAGNPIIPKADLTLQKGWIVCLHGHRTDLPISTTIRRDNRLPLGKVSHRR